MRLSSINLEKIVLFFLLIVFFIPFSYAVDFENGTIFNPTKINFTMFAYNNFSACNVSVYEQSVRFCNNSFTITDIGENVSLYVEHHDLHQYYPNSTNLPQTISFNITGIPSKYDVIFNNSLIENETDGLFDLNIKKFGTLLRMDRVPRINESSFNVTSAYSNQTAWASNFSQTPYTNDSTPSITFETDIACNASISKYDLNYTAMIANDSTTQCSTSNSTAVVCTLPSSMALKPGNQTIYISLISMNMSENLNQSTSGQLQIYYDDGDPVLVDTGLNRTVNESIVYDSINLSQFLKDPYNETITFGIDGEDTTNLDCSISGENLSFVQGALYPTGNFSCNISVNDSINEVILLFGVRIRPYNLNFSLNYGISSLDFLPLNDSHRDVDPEGQTSAKGVFNLTNHEDFNLTIQFFSYLSTYFPSKRMIEDFDDVSHWKYYDEQSLNTTYNLSLRCLSFQPRIKNITQGKYSGGIIYSFNNSQVRESWNGTHWNKFNFTFNCSTLNSVFWNFTTNFTGYNETYNDDWSGYTWLNFSYLGDNSSNLFELNITNKSGGVVTSGVLRLRNDSIWQTAKINISTITNISQIRLYLTYNQSAENGTRNQTGLFFIDNMFIYNDSVSSPVNFSVNITSLAASSIDLNTSYINISRLENGTSQDYWLFMDYTRLNAPLIYDIYARGVR